MHGQQVHWDHEGPRKPRSKIVLYRPKPGTSLRVVLLSSRVTGVWLHWVEGRSVPCLTEDEGCPFHVGADNWSLRWKGFAACISTRGPSGCRQLAELTAEAWAGCEPLQQLSDRGKLRGVEIELVRAAGGARGPVRARVLNDCRPVSYADTLPDEPDVIQWLETLFPCKPLQGGGRKGRKDEAENSRPANLRVGDASSDEGQAGKPPVAGQGDWH